MMMLFDNLSKLPFTLAWFSNITFLRSTSSSVTESKLYILFLVFLSSYSRLFSKTVLFLASAF